jgi:glycosyltransferase involved in cell wall biosynthesis
MVRLSVIVPARNAAVTLPRTLAGLASQEIAGNFEVVVVDDASIDTTGEVARAAALGPVVAVPGRRRGAAAARNAGVAAASGEILAFTDADCFPSPGWLAAGLAAMDGADVVQGSVLPDPAASPGPFDRTLHVGAETGLYETANLFVRRDVFDRVGGFEDWLGPVNGKGLGEDALFGWAARRAGARTSFAPAALVYHAVSPRGAGAYIAERLRARYFPALAARIPELRDHAMFGRVFLSPRTAAFDLAVVGGLVALSRRAPYAAIAGAPYAALVISQARGWGRGLGPRVAVVGVTADVVGLAALAGGSFQARTLLL